MVTKKTYTPAQIAELLQVKEYTVREWLREGALKGVYLGNRWRVEEEELQEFIERRKR
jgi:excisionase family DNA binding protein